SYTVAPADIGQRLVVVVTARNSAGTTSAASVPTAIVTDTTPPTIPVFSTPDHRFQRQVRFAVAWTASAAGTRVGSYDIRYRSAPYNGAFGVETAWLSSPSATNATFVGSPGTTYCFSARASDRAGNVSGWSNETCTALPVDDRTLAVASGPGARRVAAGYYNGTYSSSAKAGAGLVLHNIETRRLALLATRCPSCGTVQVFWNGRLLKAVTLTAPTLQKRQLVALGSFSSVQTGTATVRVSSSGRPD